MSNIFRLIQNREIGLKYNVKKYIETQIKNLKTFDNINIFGIQFLIFEKSIYIEYNNINTCIIIELFNYIIQNIRYWEIVKINNKIKISIHRHKQCILNNIKAFFLELIFCRFYLSKEYTYDMCSQILYIFENSLLIDYDCINKKYILQLIFKNNFKMSSGAKHFEIILIK